MERNKLFEKEMKDKLISNMLPKVQKVLKEKSKSNIEKNLMTLLNYGKIRDQKRKSEAFKFMQAFIEKSKRSDFELILIDMKKLLLREISSGLDKKQLNVIDNMLSDVVIYFTKYNNIMTGGGSVRSTIADIKKSGLYKITSMTWIRTISIVMLGVFDTIDTVGEFIF